MSGSWSLAVGAAVVVLVGVVVVADRVLAADRRAALQAALDAELLRALDEAFDEFEREAFGDGPWEFTGILGSGILDPMRTLDEARNQFAYHAATEDTAPRHAKVRQLFRRTLDELWEAVPDGPEKTLAIRKLQEAQMFANLAVALTAPVVEEGTKLVVREIPAE